MAVMRIGTAALYESRARRFAPGRSATSANQLRVEGCAYVDSQSTPFFSKRTTGEEGPFCESPEALLPRIFSLTACRSDPIYFMNAAFVSSLNCN